jgi:hypothetical protein
MYASVATLRHHSPPGEVGERWTLIICGLPQVNDVLSMI